MFRELRLGIFFYLSAMAGAVVGYLWVYFPHVRSGDPDSEARDAALMAIGGAFAGGWTWLAYKYNRGRLKGQ